MKLVFVCAGWKKNSLTVMSKTSNSQKQGTEVFILLNGIHIPVALVHSRKRVTEFKKV